MFGIVTVVVGKHVIYVIGRSSALPSRLVAIAFLERPVALLRSDVNGSDSGLRLSVVVVNVNGSVETNARDASRVVPSPALVVGLHPVSFL